MTATNYKYEESGHFSSMLSSLNNLRRRNIGCDCSIDSGGIGMPVHFAIVASASEYCRAQRSMRHDPWLSQTSISVQTGNCSVERNNIDQCVNFMYTGKAEVDPISAREIAKLSHVLQLEGLKEFCVDILRKNLSMESCESVIQIARFCKMKECEQQAIRYWVMNATCGQSTLGDCKGKLPGTLHKREKLWKSAASLLSESKPFREICPVINVLEAIQLEHFSTQFLLDCVLANKDVQKTSKAVNYVSSVICNKVARDKRNVTIFNYFRVKEIHNRRKDAVAGLEENLRQFMLEHFDPLAKNEEFLFLDEKEILSVLSSPDLSCSEEAKFNAIQRWVKHDNRRSNSFKQLFSTISLKKLPVDLLQEMKLCPLIANNPEFLKRLVDAACDRARDLESGTCDNSQASPPSSLNFQKKIFLDVFGSSSPRKYNGYQRSQKAGSNSTDQSSVSNFSTASVPSQTSSVATTRDSGIDERFSPSPTYYIDLSD